MVSVVLCLSLAQDLEFDRCMAESLAPPTGAVLRLEDFLPRDEAGIIRCLGNSDHAARELAAAEVRRRGRSMSYALAFGKLSRDPEVRSRSIRLRDELYECPRCGGTGLCPACDGKGWVRRNEHTYGERCGEECRQVYRYGDGIDHWCCGGCGGTGDLRWCWRAIAGDGHFMVPAEVFPTRPIKAEEHAVP